MRICQKQQLDKLKSALFCFNRISSFIMLFILNISGTYHVVLSSPFP